MALPNPGGLVLVRIGLESGAALPSDPADPALGLVLVEAGELIVALDGPVTVTRAGTLAPAVAAAGETLVLRAGDVGLFPPNVGGEVRNDGAERAVALAFLVTPPEGEGFGGTPDAGTPAP